MYCPVCGQELRYQPPFGILSAAWFCGSGHGIMTLDTKEYLVRFRLSGNARKNLEEKHGTSSLLAG